MILGRRQVLAGLGATALMPMAARAAPVGSAPFTLLNGKMFVDVTVNGVKAQAFVDSGAQFTGLDQAFARQAGVRLGLPVLMRGIQGLSGARRAQDVHFEVGGAVVKSEAIVTNYSDLAGQISHVIDAVMGGDVFRAFVVEIDFNEQRLSLHDRGVFQPPADARLMALQPHNGLMTAAVTVENRGEVRALLDLGSNVPLIISPGPAKSLGLLSDRPISTARMGGQGAATIAQIITAQTVGLAGEQFDRVPVMIPKRSVGLDANLGLPILQRFHLYLDFGGERLWLGPPNDARSEPFQKDFTGLGVAISGDDLRVNHVARGSPAERDGWRIGDVITAINGDPPVDANRALALSAHPGAQIAFTLADGKVRSLTLAEYY
jgi:predicted aspartyl protease